MTDQQKVVAHQGERYVAMIDILGFRTMLDTTPLAEVVRQIGNLLVNSKRRLAAASRSVDGQVHSRTLGVMHFSDTVLMWTPPVEDRESGYIAGGHLFLAVTELIYRSFIAGLPLRAGIGYGECFIDPEKHIFVGSAIADAYETETAQEWIGGALHPDVPWGVPYMGTLVEYLVPVKSGATVILRIALNWPDCPTTPTEYKLLKQTLDDSQTPDVPPPVRVKLANTWNFASTVLSKVRLNTVTPEGVSVSIDPLND